jgi:hypothetical protein
MRSGGIDYQLQLVRMIAMTPMLIVMFVGALLALRRLPMQPRSAWALLAALALNVFDRLGMPVLILQLLEFFGNFRSTPELWLRTLLFTLPQALVAAATWGLVLFAVFDRPAPPKFLREDDLDRDLLDSPSGGR